MSGSGMPDLATPLSAIDDLLSVIANRVEIDMIFGLRVKLLGREIERRPVRHYLGRVFATFASLVLGLPVYETQCGAKLFGSTPELEEILREPFCSRWIFDVEIIARFVQLNGSAPERVRDRIYEFPLYAWRDVPGSEVKPERLLASQRRAFGHPESLHAPQDFRDQGRPFERAPIGWIGSPTRNTR